MLADLSCFLLLDTRNNGVIWEEMVKEGMIAGKRVLGDDDWRSCGSLSILEQGIGVSCCGIKLWL